MAVRVRLTRKFAQAINGIDLSKARAGETLDLSKRDAEILIAEGWASPVAIAHDKPARSKTSKGRKQ